AVYTPSFRRIRCREHSGMTDERRQHNRVAVDWHARIGRKGLGVMKARVKDASIGGVYLYTTLDVELGDSVLLELPMGDEPENKTALIHAKIARRDLKGEKLFGYGL